MNLTNCISEYKENLLDVGIGEDERTLNESSLRVVEAIEGADVSWEWGLTEVSSDGLINLGLPEVQLTAVAVGDACRLIGQNLTTAVNNVIEQTGFDILTMIGNMY